MIARHVTRGFTLLEVVVALAILGTGFYMLLNSHYAALDTFIEAEIKVTERVLLEQALGEAEISVLMGETEGSGDFGERYPEYAYSFTSVPVWGDQLEGYVEVTVTVSGPNMEDAVMSMHVYNATQEI